MNFKLIHKHLLKFLENEVKKTGLKNVVLGLSGGIDSAVVAVLAKEVFGSDLECIMMPASVSSKESLSDANELINKFDLNSSLVSIEPYIQTYKKENVFNNLELGNFMARIRMITLYDKSAKNSALVLGTSNKSELLLGYGTIYGDLASAINPIGDMYKTWIFGFAGYLGVPKSIIIKPPSADLREGQSDEADLGASYEKIDTILIDMVENRVSKEELLNRYNKNIVNMIYSRVYKNQFKRKMPLIAKITERTIGMDFLYPRDIGM